MCKLHTTVNLSEETFLMPFPKKCLGPYLEVPLYLRQSVQQLHTPPPECLDLTSSSKDPLGQVLSCSVQPEQLSRVTQCKGQ